jgi:hypothetical protein
MEKIMNEVLKNRQLNLPVGILKVDDLVDWVHKIGFAFNFKHPGLPDVNLTIEEKTADVEPVNSDLKEMIDKEIILSLGLTPEIIDNAFSPDFATTIVANNSLLNKRISKYQQQFDRLITKNIIKQAMVDGLLRRKLEDILKPNIKSIKSYIKKIKHNYNEDVDEIISLPDEMLMEMLIREIIKGIEVTLPKPETKEDDKLADMFEKYKQSVEDMLDTLFSEDAMPEELVGELSGKIENIKQVLKVILIKKWITENGYMEDVATLFSLNEEGKPVLNVIEEYETYLDVFEQSILPFLKLIKKKSEKIDKKLEKIENNEDNTENESTEEESEEGMNKSEPTEEPTEENGEEEIPEEGEENI